MYALVDCNNFYASCERVFRPDLQHKPVAILSNNDGCVIARSNEAKRFIPMGAPAFKFKQIFKKERIHVFSSNYALYGDMSTRVMNILSEFSPDIEVYSIDEAFLHLDGFERYDLAGYGKKIRYKVTKSTGIPISIGFAPSKALSKVANRIAKKFPEQTGGVYIIDSEEKRIKALKWLKIGDVWGIGRKYAKRLKAKQVNTAFDLTRLPDAWVRKEMSVVGLRLKHELEGKPRLSLDDLKNKKAIATTRSFERMYTDYENLKERISTFTISCAEKLRRQKSHCNLLMVFLHTNGHRKDLKQYSRNIVVKTEYPTNSSIDLVRYAVQGLKAIYKEGYAYKKAGVIVMELTPEETPQIGLFKNEDPRHRVLMQHIDHLNKSIGYQKVRFAGQDLQRMWKMNQNSLSPRYTTRLDEIIEVRV
jgi:DNA polymerase V